MTKVNVKNIKEVRNKREKDIKTYISMLSDLERTIRNNGLMIRITQISCNNPPHYEISDGQSKSCYGTISPILDRDNFKGIEINLRSKQMFDSIKSVADNYSSNNLFELVNEINIWQNY